MSYIKNLIRYTLWLCGLRAYLPQIFINRVTVNENNEPFETLKETEWLKFSKNNPTLTPVLRQRVAHLLQRASRSLPHGYCLSLIEAYRSPEEQERKWRKEYIQIKLLHPNESEEEQKRLTRLRIAEPTGAGPHQTGGAVDVSLLYNGSPVYMGTGFCEFNSKTPTHSKEITASQKHSRKILLSTMTQLGFVNYPGEWWHFSYGDRMWAAYKRKRSCMYGPRTP